MADFSALIPEWAFAVTGLRILLILAVTWVALFLSRAALLKMEARLLARTGGDAETEKRTETLIRLVRQVVLILIGVIALLVILGEVGVDLGPILASAGILGLAIGFGAQNLVRDVISGFFMLLENQVRVGDVAIINGTGGLVEEINYRTIILRDLSGTVHVFSNGSIQTLSNMTHGWSAHVFDIGVAYSEDIDRVMALMREVGDEMREDAVFGPMMLEDLEIFGLDRFADSAVVIKGRLRTLPIKQWEVGREFRRRLKIRFDCEGVVIPFPQRTLHFGDGGIGLNEPPTRAPQGSELEKR